MAGDYTRGDIARMERELSALRNELRCTPERREQLETAIRNLEYELNDAKRRMK